MPSQGKPTTPTLRRPSSGSSLIRLTSGTSMNGGTPGSTWYFILRSIAMRTAVLDSRMTRSRARCQASAIVASVPRVRSASLLLEEVERDVVQHLAAVIRHQDVIAEHHGDVVVVREPRL